MTLALQGQKFGRLTALRPTPERRDHKVVWLCTCDCGTEVTASAKLLRNGKTKSCGCLRRESASARATKHGGHGSPEYQTWRAMRERCLNPKAKSYPYYGGRGITICPRWLESFAAFLEDMGPRPFAGATIEREKNDGNYTPDNCRWATRAEQTANRRVNGAAQ